jgi:microcystin-dependent protein
VRNRENKEIIMLPFLGEIRLFPYSFAPSNWALCQGQLLPISQYSALYSLLGTTYGGDGVSNFGLPDLQGRVAIHYGTGLSYHAMGQKAGITDVVLGVNEIPQHNHTMTASTADGTQKTASGAMLAKTTASTYKGTVTTPATLSSQAVNYSGSNLTHSNLQPFQAINYCIALQGIFPSRN